MDRRQRDARRRCARPAAPQRAEVRADVAASRTTSREGRELRRPGSVNLVEDTQVWGDRVRPIARPGDAVDPLVIDDFEVEPAADPVVGPELVAARTRIGLTVDQLAERTRIRPHVIESIEVDDFAPCGGDFYARGHLRTLARVLGVDAAPLLRAYDDKYADAPINPRRVFEAELATGVQRRHPLDPGWPELVDADRRGHGAGAGLVDRPPGDGHPGDAAVPTPVAAQRLRRPVAAVPGCPGRGDARRPTAVTATHLKVTNGNGQVVFDADVEAGEIHRFDVRPPVGVSSRPTGTAVTGPDQRQRPGRPRRAGPAREEDLPGQRQLTHPAEV